MEAFTQIVDVVIKVLGFIYLIDLLGKLSDWTSNKLYERGKRNDSNR